MQFDVLTLFPELIDSYLRSSILGRAYNDGVFQYRTHQIRDYAVNDYGQVDDTLYGGGVGMLMMAEPIYQSWLNAKNSITSPIEPTKSKTIFLSPKGRTFNQMLAKELLDYEQIILLCGHYEGVDARAIEAIDAEEISIGDYVISGGELGALVIMDAIIRMLPGTFADKAAFEEDSHYNNLLEAKQYTKPQNWRGYEVPEVLLSGHHKNILSYKHNDSLLETFLKRPDLFNKLTLKDEELRAFLNYYEKSQKKTP